VGEEVGEEVWAKVGGEERRVRKERGEGSGKQGGGCGQEREEEGRGR
jgi:hypothetical protein